MDQNILQIIKDAAIGLLKANDPETEVFTEEIMRTEMLEDMEKQGLDQRWYYVEVSPTSFKTEGMDETEGALTVSIDYYEPEESVRQYGEKAIALDAVLRPVFRFDYGGERRAITVQRLNASISGRMLHLTFPLTFLVSDEEEESPLMGEIELIIN